MYPGISRTAWQQPIQLKCASPPAQSQSGWFTMQKAEQHQSSFQANWTKDTSSNVHYITSTSQDQHVYVGSPTYSSISASTPSYVFTNEFHAPPLPPARTNQFLRSPVYPRPLTFTDSELCVQAQDVQLQIDQKAHAQTIRRRNKQIAIGRWNNEEHQWFLKGLEMFQGPAWGEIAQLIGTRTSTQVRTHAQKFFTKLAKFNQTLPYFELQIQKERSRLVAQGASITPTALRASSASTSATLSPRKHLTSNVCPQQSLKRLKDEKSPAYVAAGQAQYPTKTYDVKSPMSADSTMGYSAIVSPSMAEDWIHKWTQQGTQDDARQWPLSNLTPSFQQPQMQMDKDRHQDTSPHTNADIDSLPPMNKLLFHSTTS